MRKNIHRFDAAISFGEHASSRMNDTRMSDNVEIFKRRTALRHFSAVDANSKLFFERIVNVKKIRDLVFITKASAKSR